MYPAEIEQCLELHPGVREAAVLGVEHAELGQEVKAIVVVAEPPSTADERARVVAELKDFVAERLAYFKVPAHWELRSDPLPRNATGKVRKDLLRAQLRAGEERP